MRRKGIWIGLGVLALLLASVLLAARTYMSQIGEASFWEDDIVAFEEADRDQPPEPGAILFTGSSSIVMWDSLEEDMAPWQLLPLCP